MTKNNDNNNILSWRQFRIYPSFFSSSAYKSRQLFFGDFEQV